jgi:hypothetical protein
MRDIPKVARGARFLGKCETESGLAGLWLGRARDFWVFVTDLAL